MRKVLAAGAAVTLLFAAAPMTVVQAATPAPATAKPKPPPKIPRKRLDKQMPRFATQPKVVKGGHQYAVQAKVRLIPWHTETRNIKARADKFRVTLDVAKKSVQVRYVGLSKKSRKQGLMWSGKIGPQVVTKAGTFTISLPVTKQVGKSLAAQSPKQQRKRLRMTVEHRKDARQTVKGRDVIQLAQSGQSEDSLQPKAKGATLSGNGESTSSTSYINNLTPYNAQASVQGVNCVSDDQWSGQLQAYQSVSYTFQVYTSGSSMANDYSDANTLSADAITALKSSATSAAQNAANAGTALFTPSGAASAAVTWAEDFVGDFIKTLVANSCSSQPSLVTTSLVLTEWGMNPASPHYPYFGLNTAMPDNPSAVSFPTGFDGDSLNGSQSSTQWHWNNGNPVPAGPGSFNWAGGLMSVGNDGSIFYLLEADSNNPTGYGPVPAVYPPNSAVENSASLTATWNAGSMVLNCDPGEWDLENPWGASLAMTPGALSPPNNGAYSTNQMYMQVSYNGTDASGTQVYNQTFTGVEPLTAFSTEAQAFTIDPSALQGITVDQWQCSIGASIQVQDWAVPTSWPTQYLTSTPNGSWWNAPNLIATAPYVAP